MSKEEQMYISAVRYALGRRTYIVSDTVNFMMDQRLSSHCKRIMQDDIETALKGYYGMECDKEEWERLLAYVKVK